MELLAVLRPQRFCGSLQKPHLRVGTLGVSWVRSVGNLTKIPRGGSHHGTHRQAGG